MFSSLFSVFSALLLVLCYTVDAAPVQPVEFIAFAPSIQSPSAGTTWYTGTTQTVSWRTDNVPEAAQGYTLTILLGYVENNSENLDIRNPLATQVPIMSGSVQVTVPTGIPKRDNYAVAVIGDSGDLSPPFTIKNATLLGLH